MLRGIQSCMGCITDSRDSRMHPCPSASNTVSHAYWRGIYWRHIGDIAPRYVFRSLAPSTPRTLWANPSSRLT